MKTQTVALALVLGTASASAADDIVIADFEADSYGDWSATGDAFGPGPARGTLPNQMPVSGFLGKGLVNSFFHGDSSTGMLTSPSFRIDRRYINFLIGGGGHAGRTCMNLVVEGEVVRTATGPNTAPGGSEQLDWVSWDVGNLAGKSAMIQIVDQHSGGWGHINVDHIVLSDVRKLPAEPARREFGITARYLHLPVRTGAPKRRMRFRVDDRTVREFEIEYDNTNPDVWFFADVSAFQGKRLAVEATLSGGAQALEAITLDQELRDAASLYQEKHRPQFHFTSRRGWLNDPNGLVYLDGEYHLFYQHNPYGWNWGNMHWGHAVSTDLVHWRELPIALYPQRFGDWCFSGSAVVDKHNTSGFKHGNQDTLVIAYTSTGRGECIAYSNDRGRSWTEFSGNPVIKHEGRDPKLLWHEPTRRWVMAVYDESDGKRWIAFYTSPDLKAWKFESRIEGYFECPDLFELPVDGDASRSKWVLYAADGKYVIGKFDGTSFQVESGKHELWYGNFYAAQTYSDAPDGRRVQIGWGNGITFPGMPFNQQMTLPCELSLRSTAGGVRMFAEPVPELHALRGKKHAFADLELAGDPNALAGITGELFEVVADVVLGDAKTIGFRMRGVPVLYDVEKHEVTCSQKTAPLEPVNGNIRLRLIQDRGSIELFGNDGRMVLSVGVLPAGDNHSLELFSSGGRARARALEVYELHSAWHRE